MVGQRRYHHRAVPTTAESARHEQHPEPAPRQGRRRPAQPPPRPAGHALRVRLRAIWPPLLVLAAAVAGWDILARATHASESVLPTPGLVIASSWADRANLRPAIWATTREAVLGVLLAIVLATLLAVLVDSSQVLRRSIYPLMVASQTLPIIALAPLVVIWFGFGSTPKVVLVALFTFFAIAVGLVQGLASTDRDATDLLRTMGATRRQLLWRVRLPSAVPQFFTGLKVAVTYAYVSAIVAEFVGAEQGLGVYMTEAKNAFRTDLVFGAVLVTAALTLALFGIVVAVERLAMPWRRPASREADR
jgi:ABC-type nitrate/sulfonate/bicarbonate transport system permease component